MRWVTSRERAWSLVSLQMRSWQCRPLSSARKFVNRPSLFVIGILSSFSPLPLFSPGDPLLEDVELIEGLSPTEEIDHVIMKGQMGVSWAYFFLLSHSCTLTWTSLFSPFQFSRKRDLSVVLMSDRLEDGTIVSSGLSIQDKRIPETSAAVRADCSIAGWSFKPIHDRSGTTSTRVEYFSLSDVKGWIPGVICLW